MSITARDLWIFVGRRRQAIAIVAIQLTVAIISFLVWAGFSRIIPASAAETAIKSYTWAMVGYLPLSLGLPFVLPNYYRDERPLALARRRFALVTTRRLAIAASASGVGLCVLVAGSEFARTAGVTMCLAGCCVVAVVAQQIARLRRRIGLMAGASMFAFVLPGMWAALAWAGVSESSRALTSAMALAVYLCVLLIATRQEVPRLGTVDEMRGASTHVLRVALPLVPHLVAFGLVQQGLRLMATIADGASVLAAAHYLMMFVAGGYSIVSSCHTVLAARLQSASSTEYRAVARRNAGYYAVVGVVSGAVVSVSLLSPVAGLFRDLPRPNLATAIVAGTLPVILAVYDYLSSICVRFERTAILAVASILTAVAMAVTALLQPSATLFRVEVSYGIVLLALPASLGLIMRVLVVTRDAK